jgi:hypothetical protein
MLLLPLLMLYQPIILAQCYNITGNAIIGAEGLPGWCKNVVISNLSNGFQNVICTVRFPGNTKQPPNAPWFFVFLYYAIFASALIFTLATSGRFLRVATVSFAMIFVAIPFVKYGCTYGGTTFPLMASSNIIVPFVVFILSIIGSYIWG